MGIGLPLVHTRTRARLDLCIHHFTLPSHLICVVPKLSDRRCCNCQMLECSITCFAQQNRVCLHSFEFAFRNFFPGILIVFFMRNGNNMKNYWGSFGNCTVDCASATRQITISQWVNWHASAKEAIYFEINCECVWLSVWHVGEGVHGLCS